MKTNSNLNNCARFPFKETGDGYRLLLVALFTLLTCFTAEAQGPTVLIPASGSNTNACGNNTTLYDNGGISGNYADNSDGYTILQNSGSGIISISGTLDIENSWEDVYIYSGAGIAGTLLQSYTGTQTINYTGAPGEVLTVRFTSDLVYNYPGFALQVSYTGACEQLTCSGTPAPGNTTTSTTVVCNGISAILGLQNASATDGLSYQWQQSATQDGTYTNISGATGVTYGSAISATTWFRANATCSGETTASTPVEVVYTPQGNCYCTPNIFLACDTDIVIGSVQFNTLSNNTGNGCTSGNGYNDYTADPTLTTTVQPGLLYNLSLTFGYNWQGFGAWIDYNSDGIFSNSERIIFTDDSYQGGARVFPVSIPCDATPGQHRLRIRTTNYTGNQQTTPCGYSSYGEAEDYLITIAAPGACSAPAELSSSSLATTTAALAWTNPCGGTAWEVFVQAAGAGTPTGSGTAVTSMTYNATGLTPGTNYEFYVRTVCSAGSYSIWSNPVAFQTLPLEQTFGAGVWNVNGYNGSQLDTFAGYYVANTLDLNTSGVWSMSTSPSTAPGYIGVPIDYDAHSYRAMRKGFPEGCYTIQLLQHDDDTALYIDGTKVFEHISTGGDSDGVVWTGPLDENSEIEIVTKEFGGYSSCYYYFGTGGSTYYVDADNDGFGNYELPPINACSAPAGYALEGGDCDDNNSGLNPGQAEILENGIDENCNGMFDDEPSAFAPYCGGLNYTSAVEPITSVNFAGINNTSSATVNGTPPMENFMAVTG
ncbi:MAG TPA: GEVED domain-containing protein, partial [Flavobacterium sp.]